MIDTFGIQMHGVEQLTAKLDAIGYDMKRKGGRTALRKAAMVVQAAAYKNALALDDPKTTASIADNVSIRWGSRRFKGTGDLLFSVGVGGGARYSNTKENVRKGRVGKEHLNTGGNVFYWRFLEFGTQKMAARPFLRKALADNTAAATRVFIHEYGLAVDRAIKRAAKESGA